MSTTSDAVQVPAVSQAGTLHNAVMAHLDATMSGSIWVRNEGWYVARFFIEYTFLGQRFTAESGDIALGVNRAVPIPADSTDIYLKVQEMWGFGWSDIFTQNFAEPVRKCYKVWGTTLNPSWEETSC